MRRACWLLLLAACACGQTVQTDWSLAAVGVECELSMPWLLRSCAQGIERELPGLRVGFDVPAYREVGAPEAELDDFALVRWAIAQAEADGLAVADYDVVFVFSPRFQSAFGYSHIDTEDSAGRQVRGAFVATDSYPQLEALLRAEAGTEVDALLAEWGPSLRGLLRLPGVREAIVAPTVAHELGHFLAPGDGDIRDGYQAPWIKHATSEDDNPDGHGIECCMHKGGSVSAILRKLAAQQGRLIAFCDTCRERLGLPPAQGDGGG